mgnify:CR=1 FL=1
MNCRRQYNYKRSGDFATVLNTLLNGAIPSQETLRWLHKHICDINTDRLKKNQANKELKNDNERLQKLLKQQSNKHLLKKPSRLSQWTRNQLNSTSNGVCKIKRK